MWPFTLWPQNLISSSSSQDELWQNLAENPSTDTEDIAETYSLGHAHRLTHGQKHRHVGAKHSLWRLLRRWCRLKNSINEAINQWFNLYCSKWWINTCVWSTREINRNRNWQKVATLESRVIIGQNADDSIINCHIFYNTILLKNQISFSNTWKWKSVSIMMMMMKWRWYTNITQFLVRDSMLSALYAIAHPSVRQSICLSQKRFKLGSCNFHHTVAPSLSCLRLSFIQKFWRDPPLSPRAGASNNGGSDHRGNELILSVF